MHGSTTQIPLQSLAQYNNSAEQHRKDQDLTISKACTMTKKPIQKNSHGGHMKLETIS